MISKQYVEKLIHRFKKNIKKELPLNVCGALELISNCADVIYHSNLYYVDDELEGYLASISNSLGMHQEFRCLKSSSDVVLFYDGFGHNDRGLIQIYLKELCKNNRVIYITFFENSSRIPDIKKIVTNSHGKMEFITRKGKSLLEQIEQLESIVLKYSAKDFFFYSVPNDVVATTVLYALEGQVRRLQINLTDHAFWLGARCIDYCIEFRDYGASVTHYYRGIEKDKIIKLPFYPDLHKEREFLGYPFEINEGKQIVFSGGALYKTIDSNFTYYKIVDKILSNNKNVIFWYAGMGDDSKLKELSQKYVGRVYHTNERPDLYQIMLHSTVYLSTYPVCGGLMYQFAASAGVVPVTLKNDYMSDGFLLNQSNLGIEFEDIDILLDEVTKLLNSDDYRKKRGYQMMCAVMNEDKFSEYFNFAMNGCGNKLEIKYKKFDTTTFRNEYLCGLNKYKLASILCNRNTRKTTLKYFPLLFIVGALQKIKLRKGV
ncbi:hypothetical protein ACTQ1L_06730 [Agathobacter sp. LCP21S3_B2]|uniref:hypothetical protein n=1 Tax=Agathobacter sp. LCP21S3_B2 TaxID=3438734 RepID=UPI003F924E4E